MARQPRQGPAGLLDALAKGIDDIIEVSQTKRERLWSRARDRTTWQRRLQFASGTIALLSGVAITSVFTALGSSSLTMKILGAVLAFVSGVLSLVTTTHLDPRETERVFGCAAKYAELRDHARSLRERHRGISLNQVQEGLAKLRGESQKLTNDCDSLLPSLDAPRSTRLGRIIPMLIGHQP